MRLTCSLPGGRLRGLTLLFEDMAYSQQINSTLPEYEYKGLLAETWDVFRGDTSNWPDRFFYLELIEKFGQPVLDVGCGTGRLLLDYLQQGIDIDGVDNSPDMLAMCRQKAKTLNLEPTLYEQYLETLSLPRHYSTILIPSSTLQLIIKPALVKCRYDPKSECEHTEDIYQLIVADKVVAEEVHRRSPATRSYNQAQAKMLFENAGFNPVTLYSEFSFEPVKADDTLFTVVAQKAGRP